MRLNEVIASREETVAVNPPAATHPSTEADSETVQELQDQIEDLKDDNECFEVAARAFRRH